MHLTATAVVMFAIWDAIILMGEGKTGGKRKGKEREGECLKEYSVILITSFYDLN